MPWPDAGPDPLDVRAVVACLGSSNDPLEIAYDRLPADLEAWTRDLLAAAAEVEMHVAVLHAEQHLIVVDAEA